MLRSKLELLRGRQSNILGHKEYLKYAILIPVVEYDGEFCVIFEKRAGHLNLQPGEICFPGGAIETGDETKAAAAIRETCEELNLEGDQIEVIAELDVFVSPFSIIVYPYLGYIKDHRKISVNQNEVEYIFYVPVKDILVSEPLKTQITLKMILPEDFPYELIPNGEDYTYRDGHLPQNFYFLNDEIVWGLTAGILHHFIDLLKTTL